jgi:hypothetical protein
MVDTPRKTFPELQALPAPVVDSDVLAVYRSPGPAKRTTASVFATYFSTVIGTSFTRTLLATTSNSTFLAALGQIASTALGYLATWTGAVNRTVNSRLGDLVSVKDFGAVGDGVTDDTAAFNLAIAYANAKGGTDRTNKIGTTIFIPQGRYPIGQLNEITVSHVQFKGGGHLAGTVLLHSFNGATFRWTGPVGDTIVGGGLSDVRHEYLTIPTSGTAACIVEVARANTIDFSNWHMHNVAIALRLGTSSLATASGISANNWSGSVANVNVPLIDLRWGAGFEAVGHYVFVSGVSNPPIQVGNFTNGSAVVPVPSNSGFFAGQAIIGTARVPSSTTVLSVGRATTTATFTNGSAVVTGIPSTVGFVAGQPLIAVDGAGASRIPSATTVLSVDSATQITMSANATSTGDTTIYGLITMSANATSTGTATLSGAMTTVQDRTYIRGGVGFWDTCLISNALIERFDRGIDLVAGTGLVYQHFCLSNVTMDYIRRQCLYLETGTDGIVSSVSSDNVCWFVSWETATIEMTGNVGTMDDCNITGKVPIAGLEALKYTVAAAKRNAFTLHVGGINRLQTAPAAMNFVTGSKGFSVAGCTGNDDLTASGLPFRADWAVTVGANCDEYVITGCRMTGTGGFFNWFAGNSAGSIKRQVTANGDPTSYAVQQVPAVALGTLIYVLPASGVAFTNTNGFAVEVIISGGTVTQIAKNGVNTGLTSGSFIVGPGETLTPTYSSAPTALFFGLN